MRRIIIDYKKCDGCLNCSVACMQAHRSDEGTVYDLDMTDPGNQSRNWIVRSEEGVYHPLFCRHCKEPECVMTCMSGALRKDPESGLVMYDEKRCAACFMCVMHCPYGTIRPDHSLKKIIKCDFCAGDGYEPNCVKSCPKKAIHVEEVEA